MSENLPESEKKSGNLSLGCRVALAAFGLGTIGIMCFAAYAVGLTRGEPESVYFQEDLNGDGIHDMVSENRTGHKGPMYAVEQGGNIIYMSNEAIKREQETRINEEYETKLRQYEQSYRKIGNIERGLNSKRR